MAEATAMVDLPPADDRDPHPSGRQNRKRSIPGLFSRKAAEKYAAQITELIQAACLIVLVAGDIRRRRARVNKVVLVAIPIMMQTDPMFDLIGPAERDLLRECLDRLVRSGRIEREIGAYPPYRWSMTRREALYVAPDGTRVPLDIWWADERSLGLRYALATGPESYAVALKTHAGQPIAGWDHHGILPRTFTCKNDRLVWTINGEVMPVPDETALERCLGRKLPEPHRR